MRTSPFEWTMIGVAVLLMALVLLGISDCLIGIPEVISCEILEKRYIPATHGSGVGLTTGGEMAFVSTSSPERYVLVLRRGERVESKVVPAETYASAEVGGSMRLNFLRGWLSGGLH